MHSFNIYTISGHKQASKQVYTCMCVTSVELTQAHPIKKAQTIQILSFALFISFLKI